MSSNRPTDRLPPALGYLFWLGPPLLLMGFIYWLGADHGSSNVTRGFLAEAIRLLFPGLYARLSPEALHTLNFLVRKGGHVTGYALLGLLDARAVRGVGQLRGAPLGPGVAAPGAWAAAVLWAAVDEYHQSFSASRGGSSWDVVLDSAGAAAGVGIYLLWTLRRNRTG